jgi:arylamine N-acetyltransferase
MTGNPLAPPRDDHSVTLFLGQALQPGLQDRVLLRRVAEAFNRLPYENLTKIIKDAESGSAAESRRMPGEVLREHIRFGTGGTCFSLTATLLHIVRTLGFRAEPILADRQYGPNTHCALLVWIGGEPHLLDPGYLILDPIPLWEQSDRRINSGFQELILFRGPGRIDLSTAGRDKALYRLTYRTDPAEPEEFLRAWDESFRWEMMKYPVLTRATNGKQLYLRSNYMQVRASGTIERKAIPGQQLAFRIASDFGIASEVALRALTILKARGEHIG